MSCLGGQLAQPASALTLSTMLIILSNPVDLYPTKTMQLLLFFKPFSCLVSVLSVHAYKCIWVTRQGDEIWVQTHLNLGQYMDPPQKTCVIFS